MSNYSKVVPQGNTLAKGGKVFPGSIPARLNCQSKAPCLFDVPR